MTMFSIAAGVHHLAADHGLAGPWKTHTTEHVADAAIVRERLLVVLSGIGDLAVWNREGTKHLVAMAVAHELVTAAEVQEIKAKHGLTGQVTL